MQKGKRWDEKTRVKSYLSLIRLSLLYHFVGRGSFQKIRSTTDAGFKCLIKLGGGGEIRKLSITASLNSGVSIPLSIDAIKVKS